MYTNLYESRHPAGERKNYVNWNHFYHKFRLTSTPFSFPSARMVLIYLKLADFWSFWIFTDPEPSMIVFWPSCLLMKDVLPLRTFLLAFVKWNSSLLPEPASLLTISPTKLFQFSFSELAFILKLTLSFWMLASLTKSRETSRMFSILASILPWVELRELPFT